MGSSACFQLFETSLRFIQACCGCCKGRQRRKWWTEASGCVYSHTAHPHCQELGYALLSHSPGTHMEHSNQQKEECVWAYVCGSKAAHILMARRGDMSSTLRASCLWEHLNSVYQYFPCVHFKTNAATLTLLQHPSKIEMELQFLFRENTQILEATSTGGWMWKRQKKEILHGKDFEVGKNNYKGMMIMSSVCVKTHMTNNIYMWDFKATWGSEVQVHLQEKLEYYPVWQVETNYDDIWKTCSNCISKE